MGLTDEQKQRIADAFYEGGYCFGVYEDCIQIDGFIPWEVFEKIMSKDDGKNKTMVQ